jgi:hypothetical protein
MLADGETNQSRIAEELKVSEGLITQDIQALKAQAKERIRLHLEERLPFVFETCLVRLEKTKREAIDIYNKTEAPRIKLQIKTLLQNARRRDADNKLEHPLRAKKPTIEKEELYRLQETDPRFFSPDRVDLEFHGRKKLCQRQRLEEKGGRL